MQSYMFTVIIEAESPEMAASILNERICYDEEYPGLGDPEYSIGGGQRAYTEKEWDDERQEWCESPREQVIVQWDDPQEVPTNAIARLNAEAIEYATLARKNARKLEAVKALLGPIMSADLAELLS